MAEIAGNEHPDGILALVRHHLTLMEVNKIYCESNIDTMRRMPDGFVDLTVTSPPYDDLRVYNGYSFPFEDLVPELFRVTKHGGIVVWVVNDATIDGDETGTSFRQALYFKEVGFRLHDTMIWRKTNPMPTDGRIPRYLQAFEFMFVFSKGQPKTCNKIMEKTLRAGERPTNNYPARREKGAKSFDRVESKTLAVAEERSKSNVWDYAVNNGSGESIALHHPAIYPTQLAKDHISSWSNEGDLVYDPFMGSGTTAKAAHLLGRRWIGSEISAEYVDLANERLKPYLDQQQLF